MVARLRVTSRRPQVLLAEWFAARRASSLQVEDASTEAESEAQVEAVKAWKWIDELS